MVTEQPQALAGCHVHRPDASAACCAPVISAQRSNRLSRQLPSTLDRATSCRVGMCVGMMHIFVVSERL